MNLASLISILLFVTLASTRKTFGTCDMPRLVQEFKVEDYMGTWYEIFRDKETRMEGKGVCANAKYTYNKDEETVSVVNTFYDKEDHRNVEIKGTAKCDGPKCRIVYDEEHKADYRVVLTDYNTYSLVYACKNLVFGLFKEEHLWVFSRTPDIHHDYMRFVYQAMDEQLPDYDVDWLHEVYQGEKCDYKPSLY